MDVQIIISYLLATYVGDKCQLSPLRIQKMLFLIDWRSAIVQGKQLSNINWQVTPSGPAPRRSSEGTPKDGEVSSTCVALTQQQKEVIDHVAKITSAKNWAELDTLVNSTYPIFAHSPVEGRLSLDSLAQKYQLAKRYQQDLADRHWSSKLVHDQDYYSGLAGRP